MKKLLHTLLLLLVANAALMAAEITGKVIDAGTKQAIDFANVSVMAGDQVITGVVTDEKGEFKLEVKDGQYILAVSFMGYTEVKRELTVAGKPVNVGRIQLKEDSKMLQDVEVVGQGSSMRSAIRASRSIRRRSPTSHPGS